MGEMRVDLLRLLEDLRDAYPGSLEAQAGAQARISLRNGGLRTTRRLSMHTAQWTSTSQDTCACRAAAARRRRRRFRCRSASSRCPSDDAGRLIESTVWVNEAHRAHRRAVASRAEGYHIALSVAAALAPLAVEAHEAQRFISAFLARWGEAAEGE
jgi:hypothetical protein